LEKQSLYFVRADKTGDPFEGSTPQPNVAARPKILAERLAPMNLGDEVIAKAAGSYEKLRRLLRMQTLLNCWNLGESESAAMWNLYAARGQGIAIRSTFSRLTKSITDPVPVYVGVVSYID